MKLGNFILSNTKQNFLAAASVASELYRARTIAEELSITSKNARALAVRAGSSAAGFNEITSFIEGLAKMTIATAAKVNNQAVELTRSASTLYRAETFYSKLNSTLKYDHCKKNRKLNELIHSTGESLQQIREASLKQALSLSNQLSDTLRDLRSTKIVTVVARVESARADENVQEALNAVADRVGDAGERINSHVRAALKKLNEELD